MTDLSVAIVEGSVEVNLEEENTVSHIVGPKYDDGGVVQGRTLIMHAMIYGTPVTALCGFTWIPSKNPENFPVCQACVAISKRASD